MIDDGTNLGAELLLHALHDWISLCAAARSRAIRHASHRLRSFRRELRASADHLEPHWPTCRFCQSVMNDAFRLVTESEIDHYLGHRDLDRNLVAVRAPLARFEIVRQHLLSPIFKRTENGIANLLNAGIS